MGYLEGCYTLHTTTEAPAIDDTEVTPPVEADVTTPASTESSVYTNEGFFGGPSDYFLLIKYVGHVTFRLWMGEVCI